MALHPAQRQDVAAFRCNAAESLLVHESVAAAFLGTALPALQAAA
jgi:gamma-glutamyl phosphate reductase